MNAVTVLPEAVNALHDLLVGALPGVRVHDGPPMDDPSEPDVLYVGWGQGDIAAESNDGNLPDLRDDDDAETLTIVCAAAAWRGDSVYRQARTRVIEIVRDVAAALETDPSLGGIVYDARVRRPVQFDQEPMPSGVRAAVAFTVVCRVLG